MFSLFFFFHAHPARGMSGREDAICLPFNAVLGSRRFDAHARSNKRSPTQRVESTNRPLAEKQRCAVQTFRINEKQANGLGLLRSRRCAPVCFCASLKKVDRAVRCCPLRFDDVAVRRFTRLQRPLFSFFPSMFATNSVRPPPARKTCRQKSAKMFKECTDFLAHHSSKSFFGAQKRVFSPSVFLFAVFFRSWSPGSKKKKEGKVQTPDQTARQNGTSTLFFFLSSAHK